MTDISTPQVTFRCEVRPDDREAVRAIVESTGFFNAEEALVAVELVDERLAKGPPSGYEFVFAEIAGQTRGYACYGPIPATVASFDFYWLAVDRNHQDRGLGRRLLAEVEAIIARQGGGRVYLDTSGRPQYAPTRAFYERNGYRQAALLDDFFAPSDAKVIYLKVVARPEMQESAST